MASKNQHKDDLIKEVLLSNIKDTYTRSCLEKLMVAVYTQRKPLDLRPGPKTPEELTQFLVDLNGLIDILIDIKVNLEELWGVNIESEGA